VAEYDTSGSQPISLGNTLGGVTLTGYVGKTGTRALPTLSSLPAGQAAGLEIPSDTPILVTYQVSNPGQLALKDL
jgi:hypothetical protein